MQITFSGIAIPTFVRQASAVPSVGDTVRVYGGPKKDIPSLYFVHEVVWDTGHDGLSAEVHLTSKRPKGK